MATRRSARCSVAQPADLARAWPPGRPGARARPRRGAARGRSGRCPVVTSETGSPSGPAIGWFDHAMRRRPPSFVCQWPTCGLGVPVFQTYARNSPNASRSSGGITKSRASRPSSSSRRKPVARSHASLNSRIRPSRSSTQTSDCVVSVRILANDSPTANSCGLARLIHRGWAEGSCAHGRVRRGLRCQPVGRRQHLRYGLRYKPVWRAETCSADNSRRRRRTTPT